MFGRCRVVVSTLLVLAVAGCAREMTSLLVPNQPPEVTVTGRPFAAETSDAYAWQVQWTGADADGRVERYLVALDPPSLDRVDEGRWEAIQAEARVVSLPTREALLRAMPARPPRTSHVFAVVAEDDDGGRSRAAWFAFGDSGNIPPSVHITSPQPGSVATPIVPPSVAIHWEGSDPDGQFTNRPVRYHFRLFTRFNSDFPQIPDFIAFAIDNPDSFRALYSPEFEGWSTVPGETTFVNYSNLTPGETYLFVVTAFDEAGAENPVYSRNSNMLVFGVSHVGHHGPILTMYNSTFNYTYLSGGYLLDESRVVRIAQPANMPITFNWLAVPGAGTLIRSYRWAVDIEDLTDQTPRVGPDDIQHWSQRSANATSATFGPFPPSKDTPHHFYVEVEDNVGWVSLGIIRFATEAVEPTGDLLIVDDTRLTPDRFLNGVLQPPTGAWPTAAELDTFLYAVGGFPWTGYPAGSISPPGIFAGYRYDTLGTRRNDGTRRPAITAAALSRYRHVIWLTDALGATYSGSPGTLVTPTTALRYMTAPGRANELAGYVAQGGKLWVAGGGAAFASLIAWNAQGTSSDVFDNQHPPHELQPGRFVYDLVHWQSQVTAPTSGTSAPRSATPGRGWPGQPDYNLLPPTLQRRSAATDPLPPLRSATFFYNTSFAVEGITQPNEIVENDASTLDTLYDVVFVGNRFPAMTYYHGPSHAPVLFSGFGIWEFRRAQCKALVDFVLQRIWGLTPAPKPGGGGGVTNRAPAGSDTRAARARAPGDGGRRP